MNTLSNAAAAEESAYSLAIFKKPELRSLEFVKIY